MLHMTASILDYRGCGECTWCCYFPAIQKYGSPANELCRHCKNGCEIYTDRPDGCRNFNCLWKRQLQIPEAFRPDRCGVMFELPDYCKTYVGHVIPGSEAHKSAAVQVLIQKILEAGDAVVIDNVEKQEHIFYLPTGMTKDDVLQDIGQALDRYKLEGRA